MSDQNASWSDIFSDHFKGVIFRSDRVYLLSGFSSVDFLLLGGLTVESKSASVDLDVACDTPCCGEVSLP